MKELELSVPETKTLFANRVFETSDLNVVWCTHTENTFFAANRSKVEESYAKSALRSGIVIPGRAPAARGYYRAGNEVRSGEMSIVDLFAELLMTFKPGKIITNDEHFSGDNQTVFFTTYRVLSMLQQTLKSPTTPTELFGIPIIATNLIAAPRNAQDRQMAHPE